MTTATGERIEIENPASAINANGVQVKNQPLIASNTTTDSAEDQRFAVGCWRYFDGCACNACEQADLSRKQAVVQCCDVCKTDLDAHNVADDGLCWRCAQDRDYAADQAGYSALAHGLA